MSTPSATRHSEASQRSARRLFIIVGLVMAGILVAANAHLVYVAFSSQPECVTHLKGEGEPGTYSAANSAC
jgi:hypothetical protein